MKLFKAFHSYRLARAVVIFVLISMTAVPAYAAFFEASDWTKESTYLGKTSQKLGFGFLNISAGWTAFFFEPANGQNFFTGLGKGIGYTVTNTVGGILHVVTFPVPLDIPLPHGGIVHEYQK
jgi:hypothetical protein